MKQNLQIVKIGGKLMNDDQQLNKLLADFSSLKGLKILVHGGGDQATNLAKRLGIYSQMVDGRRITDKDNLEVVVMVYAGLLNKLLVSKLQGYNENALGLSGADLNIIKATRRIHPEIDFGEVGDFTVEDINVRELNNLLKSRITPVFCSVTHDGQGNLFNTNADTIASTLALSLAKYFNVHLTFCFEYKGVLSDTNDPESWVESLSFKEYQSMKENGLVTDGMLPKLDNAFNVLNQNVSSVKIKNAQYLNSYTGTHLQLDKSIN
jgi:acetylglutamate kinase